VHEDDKNEIKSGLLAVVVILVLSGALIASADKYGGPALAAALIVVDCLLMFSVYPFPKGPAVRSLAVLSFAGAVWYLTLLPTVYVGSN